MQTRRTAFTPNINENSKLKLRKDQKTYNNETNRRIAIVTHVNQVHTQKRFSYVMKGGDPYNKKHIKYEGNGNKTQMKYKDEMARPLTRDIRISSEMATDAKRWSVMVNNIDNGLLDDKIRKQLVLGNTKKRCCMTPILALVRFP